jgi:hypothetical protein
MTATAKQKAVLAETGASHVSLHNFLGLHTDPSGGSADSMTLCMCHMADDRVVVDCLRERIPPLVPMIVCASSVTR